MMNDSLRNAGVSPSGGDLILFPASPGGSMVALLRSPRTGFGSALLFAALTAFTAGCDAGKGGSNEDSASPVVDWDGDGYACADDCDDTDADIHPGADDVWYDGVDSDCAGDEDYDADGDGFLMADDCDDADASVFPGAEDPWYDGLDSDCRGDDDFDADGDGYTVDDDCDDTDASIFPGAEDTWYDGVDSDCAGDDDDDADGDGYVVSNDCDDTDAAIYPGAVDAWYDGVDSDCAGDDDYDADQDGYGLADDCDDHDATIHPSAADAWYDGIDSDCSGNADDDADADGYGVADDCDDTDASIHPGAVDVWYDGIDSDCAGNDDDDADLDGYGADDCDDTDSTINPAANEVCDTVDNDCDGDIDDADADLDTSTASLSYTDADGDGYGLKGTGVYFCSRPAGSVRNYKDCDDTDSAVHPGAVDEWYDGIDSDCAGDDDYDADLDGYDVDVDCDDTDASVYPDSLGDCPDVGAGLVDLGSAGDFAVLAKSGIASVPTSDITGDLGLSPAAASFITGFSLTMDATNVFSTSSQVTGSVYASDYALPTPSNLTTAVSDMETAFTDAAGRAADVTELGAGDIGGMTLDPGVYKWGTGLLIPTDLALSGSASDVWIFQIGQDLTVANGVSVTLSGGALAENIFWQVAGLAEMGTTSHFEGIVLSQTSITLSTGASINGRLLAQTAVTIDSGTVVEP